MQIIKTLYRKDVEPDSGDSDRLPLYVLKADRLGVSVELFRNRGSIVVADHLVALKTGIRQNCRLKYDLIKES